LEIKYKERNIEHGEINSQMKGACLCTQRSGSNLIEEIWRSQKERL